MSSKLLEACQYPYGTTSSTSLPWQGLTACLLVLGAALGRQHVEWPVHLATSLAETVSMAAKCAAQVTLAHLT